MFPIAGIQWLQNNYIDYTLHLNTHVWYTPFRKVAVPTDACVSRKFVRMTSSLQFPEDKWMRGTSIIRVHPSNLLAHMFPIKSNNFSIFEPAKLHPSITGELRSFGSQICLKVNNVRKAERSVNSICLVETLAIRLRELVLSSLVIWLRTISGWYNGCCCIISYVRQACRYICPSKMYLFHMKVLIIVWCIEKVMEYVQQRNNFQNQIYLLCILVHSHIL